MRVHTNHHPFQWDFLKHPASGAQPPIPTGSHGGQVVFQLPPERRFTADMEPTNGVKGIPCGEHTEN